MFKVLSKIAMLKKIQATEFVDYWGIDFQLQYKVEDSTAEYNIFLPEDDKIKPCAKFFSQDKLKTPYDYSTS